VVLGGGFDAPLELDGTWSTPRRRLNDLLLLKLRP
jgi:hypothetical protein